MVEDLAHLLGAVVGDFDTDMCLICREGLTEAFLLSLEGIHCRDLDTGAKLFAALGQPVLIHGARPAWDQVQQAGRGMILPSSGPRCQ